MVSLDTVDGLSESLVYVLKNLVWYIPAGENEIDSVFDPLPKPIVRIIRNDQHI